MKPELALIMLEYYKLKDEQIKRIHYRDTMVHVQLVAVGTLFAFAFHNETRLSLLLVPWVCVVLGWSYLANDERVTAIGRYVREHSIADVSRLISEERFIIFGWEAVHRSDDDRPLRRYLQFVVDEITFCASGFVALVVFAYVGPGEPSPGHGLNVAVQPLAVIMAAELLLMVGMALLFWYFAEFRKDPRPSVLANRQS